MTNKNIENDFTMVINSLSKIATSTQDPETILTQLTTYACEVFCGDFAEVCSYSSDQILSYCWDGVGLTSKKYPLERAKRQFFTSDKIIAVNHYEASDETNLTPNCDMHIQELNIKALLSVPLHYSGNNIGIINIGKKLPYQWGELEIEQAEQFAAIATLIMRNIQLQLQLEQNSWEAIQRLEQRNRELETMNEINKEFRNLNNYELHTVIDKTVSLVSQAIPTDIITLYLVNQKNSEELILVGGSTAMPTVPNWAKRLHISKGLIGKAARNKKSVLENDIYELMNTEGTVTVEPDPFWQSVLFVPLLWGEKLMGIIGLLSLTSGRFTVGQQQFLEVITESIAAALQYGNQMKKLKEQEGLEVSLAMARTAAHELSQPLTLLTAELDMILYLGVSPSNETFIQMHNSVNQMSDIVRAYQKMIRIKTTETIPGLSIIDRETSVDKKALGR